MKKAFRKLIPTLIMVMVAASMVGTSTYAWFSMNRVVTVTGMSVTTRVDDSLLIAATNAEANFQNTLSQSREGKLRPVSTVDGVSFYYTEGDNVKGNGDAKTEAYIAYSEAASPAVDPTNVLANTDAGKTHYDSAFNAKYGNTTNPMTTAEVLYGYIDYEFYIKAVNVDTANDKDLKLTGLNLLYGGAAVTEKAWRVAVFCHNTTANTAYDTAPAAGDRRAILTLSGATNFTSGEAVNSTSSTGSVTYTNAAWTVATVGHDAAAATTAYYKVTVRLWLEGEDTTCTNETFATLNSAYTLSLQFTLGTGTAVTVIGSAV